jgi:Ala-tRNA(Pro) deacylase
LQEYLDQHHVQYEVTSHWTTYTAQEIAAAEHIPRKDVAKVVMIKRADGMPMMLVLPASHRVDFARLTEALGTEARLEPEHEFFTLFPGCEVGAEPPFGNLFAVDMLVDKALTEDSDIVFNGGTHQDSVRMRYHDFAQLIHPHIAEFAQQM